YSHYSLSRLSYTSFHHYLHLHLSLHDALPIFVNQKEILPLRSFSEKAPEMGIRIKYIIVITDDRISPDRKIQRHLKRTYGMLSRSEEHTSELQSRFDLVCRLLLEKKKKYTKNE